MNDRVLTLEDFDRLEKRLAALEQHIQAQQQADHRDLDELAARIAILESVARLGAVKIEAYPVRTDCTLAALSPEKEIPF